jgi:hypothetical protein
MNFKNKENMLRYANSVSPQNVKITLSRVGTSTCGSTLKKLSSAASDGVEIVEFRKFIEFLLRVE